MKGWAIFSPLILFRLVFLEISPLLVLHSFKHVFCLFSLSHQLSLHYENINTVAPSVTIGLKTYLFSDVLLKFFNCYQSINQCPGSHQNILPPRSFFLLLLEGMEWERGEGSRGFHSPVPLLITSKGIIPNQWGIPTTSPRASNIPSTACGRQGPRQAQFVFLTAELVAVATEGCLQSCWEDRAGFIMSALTPSLWGLNPCSANTVFPEYLGGSSQAEGAGTGQRIDCSTVCCFSVESRTCSSFLFRVLLCFSLPLVSTAGNAQPLFSSSSLWQMPRDENHSLNRAGCGSPEELPPSLMCLVSSVTALKTNIFAYFAYFTNRECWLLIRYSSGVKVGVFN